MDSHLILAGVGERVLGQLTHTGAIDLIGQENVFPAEPSVGAAVSAALDHARVLIGGDNAQNHQSDDAPGD